MEEPGTQPGPVNGKQTTHDTSKHVVLNVSGLLATTTVLDQICGLVELIGSEIKDGSGSDLITRSDTNGAIYPL